jgi:fatty acid amide hydrolase
MHALCEKPAHELSRLLTAREVSSEEVTRAHLDHIAAKDGALRAFTVVLRDEALAAARRADDERVRGEGRGPLHGLPVTVKESLDYQGQASTLGTTKRRSILAAEDAAITALLKRAGAVVLGRTNVSQILMFHESRNPVWGQTANPWSLAHTPGGSSGGEAAAIAAGMSPLGVGTDIGGSIRVPAHFAGIAGFKPTLDRWTNRGSNGALVGQEVIRSQLGPMARTARDVALAMSALDPRAMWELDPRVPPLPLPDPATVDVTKLRIGIVVDDGLVPLSAAVARGVREAAEALRARGATVVDLPLPGLEDVIYDYLTAMTSDGAKTGLSWIGDDPVDPVLAPMRALPRVPAKVREAAARLATLAGEPRIGRFLAAVGERSVADVWAITARLRAARMAILDRMTKEHVDLLLCPVHATPALPHGLARDFTVAGSWSMLWNLCQFPAGVVPVTRVRPAEAARPHVADRTEKRAAEVDRQSAGLPVGVQIVGRPWDEHVVLAAMMAVEDVVAAAPEFPRTPAKF